MALERFQNRSLEASRRRAANGVPYFSKTGFPPAWQLQFLKNKLPTCMGASIGKLISQKQASHLHGSINSYKPGYHGTGNAFTLRASSTASEARAARAARTARARVPAPRGAATQERQEQPEHQDSKPGVSLGGLARAPRALAGRLEMEASRLLSSGS